MKILKKLLAVVLAISVLAPHAITMADEIEDLERALAQQAAARDMLIDLGIVEDVPETYPDSVPRDFFAYAVAEVIGLEYETMTHKGVFNDVPASNPYAKAIETMAFGGYVSGYGNDLYDPTSPIKTTHAIKVLVNATSRHFIIPDDSPEAVYVSTAAKAEYLDDVDTSLDELTYGNLYVMLENVLKSKAVETYIDDNDVSGFRETDYTVMYKRHGISEDRGIITSNGETSLWGKTQNANTQITVKTVKNGNLVLNVPEGSDVTEQIGKEVMVYYSGEGDRNLNYYRLTTKNDVKTFKLSELNYEKTSYSKSGGYLAYNVGESFRRVRLESGCYIIYNGVYYDGPLFDFDDLNGFSGSVTTIDNDGDDAAEVVSITKNEVIYVDNKYTLENEIVDVYDNTKRANYDEKSNDVIVVTDQNGKERKPDEIGGGMVVAVAKSAPAAQFKKITLTIITDKKTAKIAGTKNDGLYKTITFDDGTSYLAHNTLYNPLIVIGNAVDFYLDANGEICYITPLSGRDWKYGMVIRTIYKEEAAEEEMLKGDLITQEGTIERVKYAQNIKIDGVGYKRKLNQVKTYLEAIPQLSVDAYMFPIGTVVVRYRINENGELSELDTQIYNSSSEPEDSLRILGIGSYYPFRGVYMLGTQVPYRSNTLAMKMSISSNDYSDAVALCNDLQVAVQQPNVVIPSGTQVVHVIAVNASATDPEADFIIRPTSISRSDTAPLMLIDTITQEYNTELEEVQYKAHGYVNGSMKEVFVSKEYEATFLASNYKRGDLISYGEDVLGHIANIQGDKPLVRETATGFEAYPLTPGAGSNYGADEGHNVMGGGSSSYRFGAINGYVTKRHGELLTINYIDVVTSGIGPVFTKDVYHVYNNASGKPLVGTFRVTGLTVVVYDKSEDKIYSGSLNDIKDVENYGSNASRIFMRMRGGSLTNLIVYND